jgi:hypothetical protein
MSRYVMVRSLSNTGVKVSVQGWLLLLAACALPLSQPWPTAVFFVWMAAGSIMLSRSTSALEIQTVAGFRKWVGLIAAWPVSARYGAALMSDPTTWLKPARKIVQR